MSEAPASHGSEDTIDRHRPIRRVHFVEFNAKVGTLQCGHIFPKYGTPLLAAILKERGYDVRIFLEGLSRMDIERFADCDAVCFPVFYPILNKVKACAERLRELRPELPIIVGGPQVCLYPETVLDFCSYAVRCEGDEALPELLECLSRGGDARSVAGVSFKAQGQTVRNPDRVPPAVPETIPDLHLIDGFERVTQSGARFHVVNTLQTSRGCHFKCRFCPTSKLFGGTYRTRSIDSVIADLRARRGVNPFFFVVDNSFLGDRKRATEMLHRIAREQLDVVMIIFERHEIGDDPELLDLMYRAGVRCVIVGIESLEDANLNQYDKQQSSAKVVQAIANIQRHRLHVVATFVLGGDGDTRDKADTIVKFVDETGVSPNLFIVHDIENDPARKLLVPLSRRFQTHYERTDPRDTGFMDYHTGSFATYFPKRMKPSTLQSCVLNVYERVFTHSRILRRACSWNSFAASFGVFHGYDIRRMNDSVRSVVEGGYMEHLRAIEKNLYDEHENLIEERLAELEGLPLPPVLLEQPPLRRYGTVAPILALPGLLRSRIRLLPRRLWGA
jgi:radical SAM superfamily enzyme YgiQ (UPF0313 family)